LVEAGATSSGGSKDHVSIPERVLGWLKPVGAPGAFATLPLFQSLKGF